MEPQRQSSSSSVKTCQNQFFINPILFTTLRIILCTPKAFFPAVSINRGLHTFMSYFFFFFFIEIHGPFNIFKYNTGKMFSWKELAMLAQTTPSSSALSSCCVCSGLLISLSYSRVEATKAGGNQPCGAFVLLNLSTPLAQKVWGTGQPRASATSFPALPLTLIFCKWVCCHSNCQITSIMPPLTSQHLL